MDILSPEIRLDPQQDGQLFEPKDWQVLDRRGFLQHGQTHAIFEVCRPPEERTGNRISVCDFIARLSHVCDGQPVPLPEQITKLGRAAIVVYLDHLGLWPGQIENLDAPEEDDIPF